METSSFVTTSLNRISGVGELRSWMKGRAPSHDISDSIFIAGGQEAGAYFFDNGNYTGRGTGMP